MQKNTLSPLATILVVFSLAVFLHPSVAELRAAASKEQPVVVTQSRLISGPRKHNIRTTDLLAQANDEQEVAPEPETVPEPDAVIPEPDFGMPNTESSSESSATEIQPEPEPPAPAPVLIPLPPQPTHLDIMLDQSGVNAHQRPIAKAVLGMLTPECQNKLETFTVMYNHPEQRGLAGRGVILVSGDVPDEEFIGLLMHEGLGHFRDITCITGNSQSGESIFRDGQDVIWNDDPSVAFYSISWSDQHTHAPGAVRRDFVTGYAYKADNFEDLAESVAYYMTQESAFRERAKDNDVLARKLQWLETYMPKSVDIADGQPWDGTIAWDATKLLFTWKGN